MSEAVVMFSSGAGSWAAVRRSSSGSTGPSHIPSCKHWIASALSAPNATSPDTSRGRATLPSPTRPHPITKEYRMTQPKIRRDGKPARASRLGVPTTSLAAPSTFQDGEKPGTWHDLVLPGPKGNPSRVLARREERGQVTPYTGETEHRAVQQKRGYRVPTWATFVPRRSPKAAHVIHIDAHAPKAQQDKRTRCEARHAVDNSQPRTDVQRRRLERIARRAS